ncbi:MAG: lytic transglycosylase F [Balneolaceae bacterium]|nr:MAG: lytic transglycosylase F [Balneolaceae bacterium]
MKYSAIILLISFILAGCSRDTDSFPDLEQIMERGTLTAITSYSPTSYFIYRGEPMGYEYELLKRLTAHLGLGLEIIVARDLNEMMDMLNRGEGDLIAYNLTVTSERHERVRFTSPLNVTRQVLVQRKPDNWRQMRLHEIEATLIRNPLELDGTTIMVRRGSSYVPRLINLAQEIGGAIEVIESDGEVTTEELIRKVAQGELEMTVADENIARLNQSYYPILDVDTPLSMPQQTAWALRHGSDNLYNAIEEWLEIMQQGVDFYVIYNKYFENRGAFRTRISSDYLATISGKLSPYDEIIRREAASIDWDWRLIASLIYQESQFNPSARSWSGAMGLMQLMPRTAQAYGAENPNDPEQNIRAGIAFMQWLEDYWKNIITDHEERKKFILASYNVGQGHVQDARRLAKKFGDDPDSWEVVAWYLIKKEDEEYYNDEVVRHGYCRGTEPVNYVENVMYLFSHYSRVIAEEEV